MRKLLVLLMAKPVVWAWKQKKHTILTRTIRYIWRKL